MYGVKAAVDFVVASSKNLERYKGSHALVCKSALKDGIVVYDAARALSA